jgi:hypothetical protein
MSLTLAHSGICSERRKYLNGIVMMKLFWKSEQRNRSNFRKAGILLPAEGIDAKDISK